MSYFSEDPFSSVLPGVLSNGLWWAVSFVAGGLLSYWRSQLQSKSLEGRLKLEENQHTQIKKELVRVNNELENVREQLPANVLETAEEERNEGNEGLAQKSISDWMKRESETISRMLLFRAEWTLGSALGDVRAKGLAAARAYTIGSQAFHPGYAEALLLRDEIEQLIRIEADPAHDVVALADFEAELRELEDRVSLNDRARFFELLTDEAARRSKHGKYRAALLILDTAERWVRRQEGERSSEMVLLLCIRVGVQLHVGAYQAALVDAEHVFVLLKSSSGIESVGRYAAWAHYLHATALDKLGQYEQALREAEAVRDARIADFGPDHPDTLKARFLVAQILGHLGRYEKAFSEAEAVRDALTADLSVGADHPDTRKSRFFVGQMLGNLGRYEEALSEAKAVRDAWIADPNVGPNHPDTFQSRFLVAQILNNLGQYEEALSEAEAVRDAWIADPNVGPNHPDTFQSRFLVAQILSNLGQYELALLEAEAVRDAEMDRLGPNHPDTLGSRLLAAHVLDNLGRYENALSEAEAVRDTRTVDRNVGPNHPDTLGSRLLVARILSNLGQYEKALSEAEAVRDAGTPNLNVGPDLPFALRTRFLVAQVLGHLGRYEEALSEAEEVRDAWTAGLSACQNHPDTLGSRLLVADILSNLGQYDKALSEAEAVRDAWIADPNLGPYHPYTKNTVRLLQGIRTKAAQEMAVVDAQNDEFASPSPQAALNDDISGIR